MTLVLVVNCGPTRLEGYMMEKGPFKDINRPFYEYLWVRYLNWIT